MQFKAIVYNQGRRKGLGAQNQKRPPSPKSKEAPKAAKEFKISGYKIATENINPSCVSVRQKQKCNKLWYIVKPASPLLQLWQHNGSLKSFGPGSALNLSAAMFMIHWICTYKNYLAESYTSHWLRLYHDQGKKVYIIQDFGHLTRY
jgi:hypothetical protein